MLLRNVVEIAEDGGGKNGKQYESFSFMILFTVTPLVMEDLQGSFYFLFMGLFISTIVYLVLVLKAILTKKET